MPVLRENEDRLGGITMPVRIVWGTEDAWIPADRARALRDLIPGATLGLVPGAGHLVHYDAPAALMNEIRAWLDSQPGARGSSPDQP